MSQNRRNNTKSGTGFIFLWDAGEGKVFSPNHNGAASRAACASKPLMLGNAWQ